MVPVEANVHRCSTARNRNSQSAGARNSFGSRQNPIRSTRSDDGQTKKGKEVPRGRAGSVEQPRRLVVARPRRPMEDGAADREIRIALAYNACKLLQMTTRPDVVVPEIGDVRSACEPNAFVVRGRLAAGVPVKILPVYAMAEM